MEFNKITIDKETFENIVTTIHDKILKANENTQLKNIKFALSEVVFDVKSSYVEDEWNSCDIVPPEKYTFDVILIREKRSEKFPYKIDPVTKHTDQTCIYRIAYINPNEECPWLTFLDEDGDKIFESKESLSKYEYKFIK